MARSGFAEELDAVTSLTAELADDVRDALAEAVASLLDGDRPGAERAIAAEAAIVELCTELDRRCARLLALQAPVADDLRLIVALMRLAAELDRSARLVGHVARTGAHVDPATLPADVAELIRSGAEQAGTVYGLAVTAFRSRDQELATEIAAADDRVDDTVRRLVDAVIDAGRAGSLDSAAVVRLGLLARYLERIADHAVTLSNRTLYVLGVGPASTASG